MKKKLNDLFDDLSCRWEDYKVKHYFTTNFEAILLTGSFFLILFLTVGFLTILPYMMIRMTLDSSAEKATDNLHEFCNQLEISCDHGFCETDGTCHIKLENVPFRIDCSTFENWGCSAVTKK